MALSALMFIVRGRNRDLVSSQQVVALRYAILASADIDRAFMLLQRTPGNTTRPKRARAEAERPRKDSVGFFPDGRPRFGAATKDGTVPGGDAQPQAAAASSTNEAVAPSQVMHAESSVSSAQPAPAQPAPEGRDDAPASSPEGDQTEASDQRS